MNDLRLWLDTLRAGRETWLFRGIHEAKGRPAWSGQSPLSLAALEEAAKAGYHLYAVVQPSTGYLDADVTRFVALFIDLDGAPLPETWHVEPNMIVSTSPGRFQAFWLIEGDMAPAEYRTAQKLLAQRYGGDVAVNNPARLMRLPGLARPDHDGYVPQIVHHRAGARPWQEVAPVPAPSDLSESAPPTEAPIAPDRLRELLERSDPDVPYPKWRDTIYAAHAASGGSLEGLAAVLQWSSTGVIKWDDAAETKARRIWADADSDKANAIPATALEEWNGDKRAAAPEDFEDLGAVTPETTVGTPAGLPTVNLTAPQGPPAPQRLARPLFMRAADLEDTEIEWLIRDYLTTESFAMIYGPPGSYKSFLAVEWACSVATGRPFYQRETRRGSVVYIAGEGFAGLTWRLNAWCQARGVDRKDLDVLVSSRPISLDYERAAETAKAIHAMGIAPALIVIDTLARNYPAGKSENDATDMGEFVRACDGFRRIWPKVTVLVVHHSAKSEASGARGSSALLGALDTSYLLKLRETKEPMSRLVCEKMKDAEHPPIIDLRLVPSGKSAVIDSIDFEATEVKDDDDGA